MVNKLILSLSVLVFTAFGVSFLSFSSSNAVSAHSLNTVGSETPTPTPPMPVPNPSETPTPTPDPNDPDPEPSPTPIE